MQKHTQLSLQNRHQIKALLEAAHIQSEIVRTIGVHRSTINRELNRNVANTPGEPNSYCPDQAQQLTARRHHDKPKHRRFIRDYTCF